MWTDAYGPPNNMHVIWCQANMECFTRHLLLALQNWAVLHLRCSAISALNYRILSFVCVLYNTQNPSDIYTWAAAVY
jgi:hypothetical protein